MFDCRSSLCIRDCHCRACFRHQGVNQVEELRERLDALEALGVGRRGQTGRRRFPRTKLRSRHRQRTKPELKPQKKRRRRFSLRPTPQPRLGIPRRPTAASAGPTRLRGAHRHPLGGLGRRPDAGARRFLHGALLDRSRAARPRRAHHARRRCSRWHCWPPANGPVARKASRRSRRCRSPIFRRSSPPPAPRWRSRRFTPPTRCTISWCPQRRSSCWEWWRWARWPRRCCTDRRWPASASPPPSRRRCWCLPTSRTSGRCISIWPSSPRRRSGWRGSGCGAGSRSPPWCSRCSGPSPACNADRRWSDRTRSTSSPDSSSPPCWWSAASCSARPPRKARSSRSRPLRSASICSAPR